MDLPSSRELELETLLRQRDGQLAELTDEITRLRQHLSVQPAALTSEPVTLPPALISLLLPHLNAAASHHGPGTSASSSTAALTQRVQLLQQENDELYEILKRGETGKLKEEVKGLRRVVTKLENALRDSHQVISSLSNELDKSYEALATHARQTNSVTVKSSSRSPRNSYHHPTNHNSSSKHPPTGPRAFKKPRISESSPQRSAVRSHNHSNSSSRYQEETSPRLPSQNRGPRSGSNVRMDVDEDARTRPRSPSERSRERHYKDWDGERENERGRDRDGGRRNGGGPGRPRKSDRGTGGPNVSDRTLAERMGL